MVERYLNNVFNLYKEERIFARKCKINYSPNKQECKQFLNTYHIQGNAGSSKQISLEYNNETVAVMIFKGNVLSRYTTSKNVVGGFSKLINASGLEQIETFVDLDMFTGDTYLKCGFVIKEYIPPDYKYVKKNKRIHKFNYRKKRFMTDSTLLYIDGFTEHQLALLNKLYRIYDSGKYKLEFLKQ